MPLEICPGKPGGEIRAGDWIQTSLQIAFYPMDPRQREIHIEDIAHALSNQCRFSGHTRRFYSVAEHSVHVSRICDPADALWGLLHDASEAYMQDVARPLKMLPEMRPYRQAEAKLQAAIMYRYGLGDIEPASVKAADKTMLAVEARDLMSPVLPGWKWIDGVGDCAVSVEKPWSPEVAKNMFLKRFAELSI